ncbi:hypothetical protein L1987_13581 [Smallanthus sonchifolius]|uniref:Uncharacterized protein n=1 Tax=Smallanthus sonchifolius TaxID=185202 RepID=A0ACB9JIG1_9ASTR|nr:hypothetical protein L1987_13581 [Smallanthus sonchifolius]
MTGESKIVTKDDKSPFLMSGCKVADGYGTMLAASVGINTEWGLLMASISQDNGEETPLQVRLNGVATFIGIVGLVVVVSVLVILLARFFTRQTEDEKDNVEFIAGKTSPGNAVDGAIKIFTDAVTIVVTVLEGLPLAVTLTVAKMLRLESSIFRSTFYKPAAKSNFPILKFMYTGKEMCCCWGKYDQVFKPSKLQGNVDFHLFKAGVEPKWGDPECANGGKRTITSSRKPTLETMWLETVYISPLFNLCISVLSFLTLCLCIHWVSCKHLELLNFIFCW